MVVGVTVRAVIVTRAPGGRTIVRTGEDGARPPMWTVVRWRRGGRPAAHGGNATAECDPEFPDTVPGRSGVQPWAVAGAGAATVSAFGAGVSSTRTVASSPAAPAATKEIVYAVAEGGPPSPST